jgi:hypothetical protein
LKRFEAQRHRGTTSFGFYLPQKDKLTHNVKESRIKSLLKRTKGENDEVLFHHRLSTSTVDVRNACHPFSTKDFFEYQYVGVHNGMISNDDVLKAQHDKLGIQYVSMQPNGTFNDSEALIYDLARYFEGEKDTVTAAGSIAFIVVKKDMAGKPLTLFFGTNRGDLKMKKTAHSMTISSEGEGESVRENYLHIFDYETETLRSVYMNIPRSKWYTTGYVAPKSTTTYGTVEGGIRSMIDSQYPYRSNDDGQSYLNEYLESKDDTKEELEEYRELYGNEDFEIRLGDRLALKKEFLSENQDKPHAAALQAEVESMQAEVEMKTWEKRIVNEDDEETQEAIINYWTELEEYVQMLKDISDELFAQAKREADEAERVKAVKEERAKQPFGFQFSRPVQKGGLLPPSTK